MKKMVELSIEAGKLPGKSADILIPTGCGPDVATVSSFFQVYDTRDNRYFASESITLHLEEEDPRIAKVVALANLLGADVDLTTFKVYSEEDRQNARLLLMSRSDEFVLWRGSAAGTKFDMKKGCWNCGTGMQQTWHLHVKSKDLPTVLEHRAIATLSNEIMVDLDLRKTLVGAGITGISFAEVHARNENKEWSAIARDQILIEHTMPPIRAEFPPEGEKAVCQMCRRGGHMIMPENPYREEDLVGMQDFNLTWEWFGGYGVHDRIRDSAFPRPNVLVTPRVVNIVRDADFTTFEWTPVGIEG